MVTSFVQYTLIAPSYINILNVYAVSCMLAHSICIHWLISRNWQFANVQ